MNMSWIHLAVSPHMKCPKFWPKDFVLSCRTLNRLFGVESTLFPLGQQAESFDNGTFLINSSSQTVYPIARLIPLDIEALWFHDCQTTIYHYDIYSNFKCKLFANLLKKLQGSNWDQGHSSLVSYQLGDQYYLFRTPPHPPLFPAGSDDQFTRPIPHGSWFQPDSLGNRFLAMAKHLSPGLNEAPEIYWTNVVFINTSIYR
jgi:hypothetical protein